MNELFFTPFATENEHYFIQEIIENSCKELGLKMLYYRKFKNNHHPGYREVKVSGSKPNLNKFIAKMKDEAVWDYENNTLPNRHRKLKEEIAATRAKYTEKEKEITREKFGVEI